MPEWKFYREHGNIKKEERVEPEKWQWVADYGKESLYQFDKDGVFHQFKEIDQSKLASFRMICEGQKDIIIKWNKDYKLIHFYRNMSLENGQIRLRLYCGDATP